MTTAPHRILLVPDTRPRPEAAVEPKVRRYRLARLRIADTRGPSDPRFANLGKAYD